MNKKIKLFDPIVSHKEEFAVKKVLKSNFWASGAGIGKVLEFETKFNKYIGSDHCVAVNNGTAALHLALSLVDIRNKEVILPSLSFVSTAHAVVYNGGKPVFVDVDPINLSIDPKMIHQSITKNTAVILPVHFGGMPCDLTEIIRLCKEHGSTLIEDAAHAAGATYKNTKIGNHGMATCFSFHPVKNLAMPTGGAITLNGKDSDKFKNVLRIRRWCGISNRKGVKYDVTDLGWNFYMNEFSAAIGIEQLKKLDYMNTKRKKIAKRYSKELEIETKMPFNNECSYHLYWIQVRKRDEFIKKMKENNIETGIHYIPIHKMSFYKQKSKLPVTERVSENIVSLPIHPNLDESDVNKIIKLTNRFS
ncbi:MAG: DegT/DnrJ/EryC1/StrS family aminotransferase [Nitrosopumilaceae archaeon]